MFERLERGFTLIELLVVVAIMGLLGTASVGGYRQMQRGMADRGAMQNVNSFLSAAFQRAQIDQKPVAVYFWNETLSEENEERNETLAVRGHAVAVRMHGRISRINGQVLIDEFGDLEQYDEEGKYLDSDAESTTRLYQMGGGNDSRRYSLVRTIPRMVDNLNEFYVTRHPRDDQNNTRIVESNEKQGRIVQFGYERVQDFSTQWCNGSAYGFEFQTLDLPRGYIFESDYSTDTKNPIRNVSKTVAYYPGSKQTTAVTISAFLPNASGVMAPKSIGSADVPNKDKEMDW